ncbi:hypothetical protein D3C80_2164230 [compost metagenome]
MINATGACGAIPNARNGNTISANDQSSRGRRPRVSDKRNAGKQPNRNNRLINP